MHADWFVAQASLPPLYHDLLSLPLTDRELETRLEVDVAQNLLSAPGVRVWRDNSGVSNNNRVIERHRSRYGAYWKSYDFAGSVGTQNIFTHPLSFTHDGGEVVFNLPNGLQGYYITNASGFRLDDAPINIVSNPAASDPTVRNGLSCFGCHTEGVKTFEDEVRSVIESNATPAYDKEQALRLYVEQSEMDALLQEDTDRYRGALEATGGAFGGIEPISRFHEVFQGTVDASYAAAAVGLETEAFLEKIRENIGLQNIGLLVLDSANGSMKRDTWTSSFKDILFALNFPELVDKPPVPPEPVRPPGGFVHIPDPNLRAAIAEALGKSPTAPITVQEMEGLDELRANGRGIQDLSGLQFATNVTLLRLANNEISDLSSIAGLINLRDLEVENNRISDISPYRGLKNLVSTSFGDNMVSDISPLAQLVNLDHLAFINNNVSDLSPLAGLINLKKLNILNNDASDLSPLAGLINLTDLDVANNNISDLAPIAGLINLGSLEFSQSDVSDLSPLAGLVNLQRIRSWGHSISDLSPLAGLTKLERVDFCSGHISDLTPLAGLPGLKELYLAAEEISDISSLARLTGLTRLSLARNDISDISPLAGLTQLKWLEIYDNEISDFSPLDGLRKNITLIWYNNPGFPKGGPKIEGPWLWVLLPDTVLEGGTDLLSEASGGLVTEMEIATHGATAGQPLGDDVWTVHRLPSTGSQNIKDMLQGATPDGVIYGSVSLHSPREQNTTMYVGSDYTIKVWLNGTLMYEELNNPGPGHDYQDFFPVTLKSGRNVLLVAVHIIDSERSAFFRV